MAAKRALIVDDSRSARLLLERILEKHQIGVDSAETAEAAIEYLATNRPDVIFMDHMMPGMDGLQAVHTIKNDPRTATIPIMMYTSQAGELYLGQARALGAVGVLPKQIKPADVSQVLHQLHLVDEPRGVEQAAPPRSAVVEEIGPPPEVPAPSVARLPADGALKEHFAELRRALVTSVDTQTDRIAAELRALLLEGLRPPAAREAMPWGWIATGVAVGMTLVLGSLWLREMKQLAAANAQVAQLQSRLVPEATAAAEDAVREALSTEGKPALATTADASASNPAVPADDVRPLIMTVPYGADAMGGGRLDTIRQFLYRLARDGVTGVVDIKTFAGRFCLMGNASDGFSLAPDDMPYAKCDAVGNPIDDALTPVQRTPIALANLVGEIRHTTHGALDVEMSVGDPTVTVVPYPIVATDLTAGEWNRAGSSNNRVEVRLR